MFWWTPRLRQAVTPVALAVVSLLAAVALWVAVTDAENPRSDQEFPVALRIQPLGVPEGLAVRSITPDAVRVFVRATDEEYEELTAANFRATVNLTGIRGSQTTQPITVDVIGLDDVEVVETTATFAEVTLESEASKQVPVQVNRSGTQAQGFIISTTEANPQQVTVTGASSLVELVESAVADVNLTGLRSTLQQRYNLTPRDASGAEVPLISVSPSSAEIQLTIEQQERPEILPVVADLQGDVADGFNIVGIDIDPDTVLATGSLGVLGGINELTTEPIDVGGATVSLNRSVALQIPQGLQASRASVNVTIHIEPAPGSRAIAVAPVVEDVPDGLVAILQTTTVTVRVQGVVPVLNTLTAGSFQVTVSADGLPEGVHALPPKVVVPSNVELVSVQPQEVMVLLRPP